jgi:ribosomal protein S18 acetylase RimI-like enzyme
MVSQGLASLRKKGVATAVLFVDQSNAVAKKLYESIGFWVGREDLLVRFNRSN